MYACGRCGSEGDQDPGRCCGQRREQSCPMCGAPRSRCLCIQRALSAVLLVIGAVVATLALIAAAYRTEIANMESGTLFHTATVSLLLALATRDRSCKGC